MILVIAFSCLSLSASAQTAPLEAEQQKEQLQRAMDSFSELQVQLDKLVHAREAECAKAVGYPPFCDCILKDLPVAWTFGQYVAITTRSKEENGYAGMSKENKDAYDKVAPIRNYCVKKINAKP